MERDTSAPDVPSHVLDYLGQQKTLTLATASPRAVPWAATLTYVNDGLAIYVWTQPDGTSARHMEQNPVAAFAIDEPTSDLRDVQGIQGSGECQVVLNPGELKRVTELFEQKFPSLSGSLTSNVSFFRLTPTELQFIDN